MSVKTTKPTERPHVCLVGEHGHADFAGVVDLLHGEAELSFDADTRTCPELIVVARSRPGVVSVRYVEQLRRAAPLAGVVALLGSWCEGQARASRPVHDALRLYWYEFAPWWRRQLELRTAGGCPDWARPAEEKLRSHLRHNLDATLCTRYSVRGARLAACKGLIVLEAPRWETAETLALVLERAGYSTLWHPPGGKVPFVRGVAAGIWDGSQLDDREAHDLAMFCSRLARESAPVIALMDFPRRDRCEIAGQAGAAVVLGKPWNNADLMTSLDAAIQNAQTAGAA